MDRYLARFAISALVSGSLLAAANLLIDPYGTLWGAAKDWPLERVFASFYPHLSKPTAYADASPETVLFGNSRVAYGFDPLHADWPQSLGPGFNYGIPSARMADSKPYLDAVMESSPPKTIIIGMDYFFDWRASPTGKKATTSEIAALADGKGPWARALARAEDIAATTFSITTLRNSIKTVLFQRKMTGYGINRAGYSPQLERSCADGCGDRDAVKEMTRKIRSYRVSFLQPDKQVDPPAMNRNLAALEQTLSSTRARGTRVVVILYPYHATLLDAIRLSGFWPDFEAWKRSIVAVAAHDGVTVLDFSIVSGYSAEPVPGPDTGSRVMQWYFDPGHFRPELGDRILQSVAGGQGACPCDVLTRDGFEAVLRRQARDIEAWRQENPALDALILDTLNGV